MPIYLVVMVLKLSGSWQVCLLNFSTIVSKQMKNSLKQFKKLSERIGQLLQDRKRINGMKVGMRVMESTMSILTQFSILTLIKQLTTGEKKSALIFSKLEILGLWKIIMDHMEWMIQSGIQKKVNNLQLSWITYSLGTTMESSGSQFMSLGTHSKINTVYVCIKTGMLIDLKSTQRPTQSFSTHGQTLTRMLSWQ